MQLSDTHRFLLMKMLQYEIDNNIVPMASRGEKMDENIVSIKSYLEGRVKELGEPPKERTY